MNSPTQNCWVIILPFGRCPWGPGWPGITVSTPTQPESRGLFLHWLRHWRCLSSIFYFEQWGMFVFSLAECYVQCFLLLQQYYNMINSTRLFFRGKKALRIPPSFLINNCFSFCVSTVYFLHELKTTSALFSTIEHSLCSFKKNLCVGYLLWIT